MSFADLMGSEALVEGTVNPNPKPHCSALLTLGRLWWKGGAS